MIAKAIPTTITPRPEILTALARVMGIMMLKRGCYHQRTSPFY
jgi:hypothetical protein